MKTLLALIDTDKQLLRDLLLSFDDIFYTKGKRMSHVRFARPTKHGWSFFKKKVIAWDMLEDVMHRTAKRHTHCHRAKIAEVLSRMVNLSEQELSVLRTAVL